MGLYWQCSEDFQSNDTNGINTIDKADHPACFNFISVNPDNKLIESTKPQMRNNRRYSNSNDMQGGQHPSAHVDIKNTKYTEKGKNKNRTNRQFNHKQSTEFTHSLPVTSKNKTNSTSSNIHFCQGDHKKLFHDNKHLAKKMKTEMEDISTTVSLESKCNTLACLKDLEDEEFAMNAALLYDEKTSKVQEIYKKINTKNFEVSKSSLISQNANPRKKTNILQKIWQRIRSGKKKESEVNHKQIHYDQIMNCNDNQTVGNYSFSDNLESEISEVELSCCDEFTEEKEMNQNAFGNTSYSDTLSSTLMNPSVNSNKRSGLGQEETSKGTSCKLCSAEHINNKIQWETESNLTAYRFQTTPVDIVSKSPNISQPPSLKSPNISLPKSLKSPNISQSSSLKSPNISQSKSRKSPNISQSKSRKSPNISQSKSRKSPNISQSKSRKSPNISQSKSRKSPNISQSKSLKSPNISLPKSLKSPNISQSKSLKSPNISQSKNRKSPNISQPTSRSSPVVPQPVSHASVMTQSKSNIIVNANSQTTPSITHCQSSLTPEIQKSINGISNSDDLKAFTDSVFYSSAAIVLSILQKFESIGFPKQISAENQITTSHEQAQLCSLHIGSNEAVIKKSFNSYFCKLMKDYHPTLCDGHSSIRKEKLSPRCSSLESVSKISEKYSTENQNLSDKQNRNSEQPSAKEIKNVMFSEELNSSKEKIQKLPDLLHSKKKKKKNFDFDFSHQSKLKNENIPPKFEHNDKNVSQNHKKEKKTVFPNPDYEKENISESNSPQITSNYAPTISYQSTVLNQAVSKTSNQLTKSRHKSSLDHLCSEPEPSDVDSEVEYLERANSTHHSTGLPNTDFVAFMDSLFGSLLSKTSLKERGDASNAYYHDLIMDTNDHHINDCKEVLSNQLESNNPEQEYVVKDKQIKFFINHSEMTERKELLFILRSYKILNDVISRTSTELIKRCKFYKDKSMEEIKMSLVKKYVSENHPSRSLYIICNQNNTFLELISKSKTKPYQLGDWTSKRIVLKGKSYKKIVRTLENIKEAMPFFLTCLQIDWTDTTNHDRNYMLKNMKELNCLLSI